MKVFNIVLGLFLCWNVFAQALPDGSETWQLRPHEKLPADADTTGCVTVFLAGTIDMGNSRDWQAELLRWFSAQPGRFLLFNPRQLNWNGGADGEMDYQVRWELDHLEAADLIVMVILGSSKSPITLLEMGLHARSGKLLVMCEPEFYRHDNVRITCDYFGVPLYSTMKELYDAIGAAVRAGNTALRGSAEGE